MKTLNDYAHCQGCFCNPPMGGYCSCDCEPCLVLRDHADAFLDKWGVKPLEVAETKAILQQRQLGGWLKALVVLLIPWALISCGGDDDGSWTDAYQPHAASAWTVTPGGATRDAGPFGSVAAGYTTDAEIDAAVDAGMTRFRIAFPEYGWVKPYVHLTDDYVLYAKGQGWASGVTYGGGEVFVCLWTRVESEQEPAGDHWIKREPPASDGRMVWRCTGKALAPALAHECLHLAIGDPGHQSALWGRLK